MTKVGPSTSSRLKFFEVAQKERSEPNSFPCVARTMAHFCTALVVDDDPQVLDVVGQILAAPGYTILTARDGYEAIRTLAERHVDLMITDARMPGLDGMQLGLQAKLMRPRLHIIYITAFADAAKDAPHGKVLQKPIRAADLVRIVEQELRTA